MSYVKTTWATGDVVTAEKLNNIEDGVEANADAIEEIKNGSEINDFSGVETALGDIESEIQDLPQGVVYQIDEFPTGSSIKDDAIYELRQKCSIHSGSYAILNNVQFDNSLSIEEVLDIIDTLPDEAWSHETYGIARDEYVINASSTVDDDYTENHLIIRLTEVPGQPIVICNVAFAYAVLGDTTHGTPILLFCSDNTYLESLGITFSGWNPTINSYLFLMTISQINEDGNYYNYYLKELVWTNIYSYWRHNDCNWHSTGKSYLVEIPDHIQLSDTLPADLVQDIFDKVIKLNCNLYLSTHWYGDIQCSGFHVNYNNVPYVEFRTTDVKMPSSSIVTNYLINIYSDGHILVSSNEYKYVRCDAEQILTSEEKAQLWANLGLENLDEEDF